MTLKELTAAGTDGIIVSGDIKNLTSGQSVSIPLTSSVTNTANIQDKLVGNSYTINIDPYNNGDTKVFSCKLHADSTLLADYLIASGNLWQSGLEGDGYRYVGTGITCSYGGNYIGTANNQDTIPTCPILYNFTATLKNDGSTYDAAYQTSCPNDDDWATYKCTEVHGSIDNTIIPGNFICFGTTDKSKCTSNQDKYMYRILGVFADSNGNNHAKLIKYKQLGSTYKWNADYQTDIAWENSDMYKGLNGSYFLTNTTFDYLQDTTWNNRMTNWTWNAVNTQTSSNSGPNYNGITTQEMYLHEMNRSTKTSAIGEWTIPSAKIGLMYASDYQLSLGSSALALTSELNVTTLKTDWINPSNNDTTKSAAEWTLSRYGVGGSNFYAWCLYDDGMVNSNTVSAPLGVRPVFYLTTDTKVSSGTGSLENPFIIEI